MNWLVLVAEALEAVAAVLRRHAPVTLEVPTQVTAEVHIAKDRSCPS